MLTPVVAQYASERIQSSAEATHIPENLAACTADADIPDDLEHIDSFIATAYYVTGTTSTGAYTTVGRIYMGADSYNECILWGAQHVNLYTTPAENAAE